MTRLATAVAAISIAALPLPARPVVCSAPPPGAVAAPAATPLRSQRDLLRGPARVAVDAAGRAWVADPVAGRVVVRDRLGRLVAVHVDLERPAAIALAADGTAFVAEAGRGRVSIRGPGWRPLGALGRGDGEFRRPADVAVDPATGEVLVADGGADVVRVFDAGGAPLRDVGAPGTAPGQLRAPSGLLVTAAGELLVVDQGNRRVQAFDRSGALLRCFPLAATRPFGLAADAAGRLYVADAYQGRIEVRDLAGAFLGTLGAWGDAPGALRTPTGVAIDPFGRLLVASANRGAVELVGLDHYSDPHALAAAVDVSADAVSLRARGWVAALVELAEAPIDRIDAASLRANGVPADPGWAIRGDADGDGVPDLQVRFDGAALRSTLAGDPAFVAIDGALLDGTPLEGTARIRLVASRARGGRP